MIVFDPVQPVVVVLGGVERKLYLTEGAKRRTRQKYVAKSLAELIPSDPTQVREDALLTLIYESLEASARKEMTEEQFLELLDGASPQALLELMQELFKKHSPDPDPNAEAAQTEN